MFLTEKKIRAIIKEQLILEGTYSEILSGSMAYVAVLTIQIQCLIEQLTAGAIQSNNILVNFLKNADQQTNIVYNQQLSQISKNIANLISTLHKQHDAVVEQYNTLINSSKGMRKIVLNEFSGLMVVQYTPSQGTISAQNYTPQSGATFLIAGKFAGAMTLNINIPSDFMDPSLTPTPAIYENIEKIKGTLKSAITHEFVHAGQVGTGTPGPEDNRVFGKGPVQNTLNNNFAGYSFIDNSFPLIREFTENLYAIIEDHFRSGSTQSHLAGLKNRTYKPLNNPYLFIYYFLAEKMIRNFATEEFEAYVRDFRASAESRVKSLKLAGSFKQLVDTEYEKIVRARMNGLFGAFGPNVLAALETDIPNRASGYTPNFTALKKEAVDVFLQKYKQIFG